MRRDGVHHLTLTVTDAQRSVDWYQQLLGEAAIFHLEGPGWNRVLMLWPDGLMIGATQHAATVSGDRFDETRVGLDHIGIGCPGEVDVRAWADRMDELGIVRGPVEDVSYGWAVTARDPDGIAVEFFCSR